MVRTAATAVRTGGGKSTKGAVSMGGSTGGSSTSTKSRRTFIGGNKLITRPIPDWQKSISTFFGREETAPKPTSIESEDGEEEETVELQPPDWQKSVTEFLSTDKKSSKQAGCGSSRITETEKRRSNEGENSSIVVGEFLPINKKSFQQEERPSCGSSKITAGESEKEETRKSSKMIAGDEIEAAESKNKKSDDLKNNSTGVGENKNPMDTDDQELSTSTSESNKRLLESVDDEKSCDDNHQAKRPKMSIDYKILEQYEMC